MAESWIIPCNVKVFNIDDHIKNDTTIVWKNSFTIKTGDIVYVYIGSPTREIRYKGIVITDEVTDSMLEKHSYARVTKKSNNYFSKKTKYIQIKLDGVFKEKELSYEKLKEHGLGQVQIQARVPRTVLHFIHDIEKSSIEQI